MELGSEFNIRFEELEETGNSIFQRLDNYYALYFDSGRSAIKFLIKEIPKGEVLLPEYICESVIQAFSGFDIKYYGLGEDLIIDLDDLYSKVNGNTKIVFIMNYFGALQPEEILEQILFIKSENNFIIIEDTTHSMFSKYETFGDYCVCSLRKWFAIPDGGVLYSKNPLELSGVEDLKRNTDIEKVYGMILKTLYLDKKIETNLLYRKILTDAEKKIDENEQIKKISYFSEYFLNFYDTLQITTKRKENYKHLLNEITNIGLKPVVKVVAEWCPFVLPIELDERDNLRKYLLENRVYCAIHWPLKDTPLYGNERSRKLSERILSLPIDQRYGSNEIAYLVNMLKNYKGSMKCR